MSREPGAILQPGRDHGSNPAEAMRLGAERPRVARLSRKVLAGGAAVGLAAISAGVLWALQNNRQNSTTPGELYTTDHHELADGLSGLPKDYAGVPRQAPPPRAAIARRSRPADIERSKRTFDDRICR